MPGCIFEQRAHHPLSHFLKGLVSRKDLNGKYGVVVKDFVTGDKEEDGTEVTLELNEMRFFVRCFLEYQHTIHRTTWQALDVAHEFVCVYVRSYECAPTLNFVTFIANVCDACQLYEERGCKN